MVKSNRALLLGVFGFLCLFSAIVPAMAAEEANSNEQTVYNFLTRTMGLNSAAACGVMANINAESGFNPQASGDRGTSYGICQWHAGRKTKMLDWCRNNGLDGTTLNGQLRYLQYELKTSYSSVNQRLYSVSNNADGAYSAGYYMCLRFEVPADTENTSRKRGTIAQTVFWPKYGGKKLEMEKTNEEVALEVIKGLWGDGDYRKLKLETAGYDYEAIQAIVNKMLA